MLTSSCLVSDSCLDESGDVCVNNRPALIGQSGVSYFITVLACVACLMFIHIAPPSFKIGCCYRKVLWESSQLIQEQTGRMGGSDLN